ncbi:MAG: formate dehydrogenase accessory sulfurtransferase FdhD, partial [Candidatus Sericytochromatia bacterium]|nr:formate dehydrogenase accessory sulfurtransferase FdhD [Candidatus Tanganyikabacteria bacterium]
DIATTDPIDLDRLKRHFYATSSCGICGRASIKAIRALSVTGTDADADADTDLIRVSAETLLGLPSQLALAQRMFADSGSLHATGIFTLSGDQACVFEDVGRHNAVDKAIGHCLRHGPWPLDRHVMLVSGRTSFEIVQKAAMARIPVLAAISGPSTLAVDLARDFGITLVGFLRGRQFNVYSRPERITGWS